MTEKSKIFNAKILLFGEYTVILDSKALTIPYTYFNGRLSYIGDDKYTRYDQAQKSNKDLPGMEPGPQILKKFIFPSFIKLKRLSARSWFQTCVNPCKGAQQAPFINIFCAFTWMQKSGLPVCSSS